MERRLKALALAQPQLVATAGAPEEAIESAFSKLRCAPPNFAVAFTDDSPDTVCHIPFCLFCQPPPPS